MGNRFECTVIGDAMVDVVLPLSGPLSIDSLRQGGVANTKMRVSAGGAANVAFHVRKLGGSAAFIGRVGEDHFGRIFLEDLESNGIAANVTVSTSENTGVVFALVFPDGERFFIDDRGANSGLRFEDVDLEMVRNSEYLYSMGYSCQDEMAWDCIEKTLAEASGKAVVVFNPGAPNVTSQYQGCFRDIIKEHVDVLVLNEAEARHLTGCNGGTEMVSSLLSMVDTVALTMGNRGSIVARRGEMHSVKASARQVVDTTGAGDAFAAGFIHGLAAGWDLKTAAELATKIAGKVVGGYGARVGYPV